jgi:uroporphyrinogen-III synthase/uroporphyrinogen III methyltransferase/synthase
VAVTRDEGATGPLAEALSRRGLLPVACAVLIEAAPADPNPLESAARRLDLYDWVICASVRSVDALGRAMGGRWPAGVRAAAVGPATAAALNGLGAASPVVAAVAGADALWEVLSPLDSWPGRRVLVLTTPGGRTTLIDGFRAAGADVTALDAYRMVPRPAAAIRRDWATAAADALVLASPRAGEVLCDAVGPDALARLRVVVAVGATTARALATRGIRCEVPERASFAAAAAAVANALEPGVRS